MENLVTVLTAVIALLVMSLRVIFGILCWNIARGKGRNGKKGFCLGFTLGIIGLFIILVKPTNTIALNPVLQQNLMQITWLWRCGALSTKEFEREKKVIYLVNQRM